MTRNLHYLAYERGQHLQDHGDVSNSEVKITANLDRRMGITIEKYRRESAALGGETLRYFKPTSHHSKWGSLGIAEKRDRLNQPEFCRGAGSTPGAVTSEWETCFTPQRHLATLDVVVESRVCFMPQ